MIIATLATKLAYNDLRIFLSTLALWNKADYPTVYLYADDALPPIEYPGRLVRISALNKYSSFNRKKMETMPSTTQSSLWLEFQMEKLNLLEWVFNSEPDAKETGVYYLDADICFLGPLPSIPQGTLVALSPHMIRNEDTAKFGKYNAGFLWVKTPDVVNAWRAACPNSRFFEQAALECFDSPAWSKSLYNFPIQHNYGWWRLWQGTMSSKELIAQWSMQRSAKHSGIIVDNEPLCSVHTHWHERFDRATFSFNNLIIQRLETLAPFHAPADKLLEIISLTP